MGNCCFKRAAEKSAPDVSPVHFTKSTTTLRFYSHPSTSFTTYIRFALQCKDIPLHFIPTDTPEALPVLRIGSETVSGSGKMILRFLDARFPHPPLMLGKGEGEVWETTPCVVRVVVLQHRSVTWHLERMVRWGEDLAKRGGRRVGDPQMGTPKMEVRKFGKSYSELLEVMLEHAQMEERLVFPLLERADRGLCKAAIEEHARDLPIMNGIKEDIKSVGVLDTGSRDYQEALSKLSRRLKSLLEHCKEHFMEEEKDVLPLMEPVELSKEQQLSVLEQCFDVMQGTHSRLFNFFMEGLLPREAMQYLDLVIMCKDEEQAASMIGRIIQ